MREADVTTLETTLPTVLELSWSETVSTCVLRGEHCWHLQLVTGLGVAKLVHGTRCCCWCGIRQTAHHEAADVEHGLFGLPPLSLLDEAIEAEVSAW